MSSRNFFAELKRRNVYKVGVAYAFVGCLVMQVAATIVPALRLPDWTELLILAFLLSLGRLRVDPLLTLFHGDPPLEVLAEKIMLARDFHRSTK